MIKAKCYQLTDEELKTSAKIAVEKLMSGDCATDTNQIKFAIYLIQEILKYAQESAERLEK